MKRTSNSSARIPRVHGAAAPLPARPDIRLDSLTSLRFVAAALVLFHHVAYFLLPTGVFNWLFARGYVGVGFFFVLSGFVLTWAFDRSVPWRAFYGRRIARVYPMHLLTAFAAAFIALASGMSFPLASSVANLALPHAWIPVEEWGASLNGASWSLSCEAFFYVMFPLAIFLSLKYRPRVVLGASVAALILFALAVLLIAPAEIASGLLYKGPWYRFGEFVIGVVLGVAVRRGMRIRVDLSISLLCSAVAYLAISAASTAADEFMVALPRAVVDLLFLPVACLLILSAASSDLRGKRHVLTRPLAIRLGEASFALYLIHFVLLAEWSKLPLGMLPASVQAIVAVAASLTLSLLAFRYVERPMERVLRRVLGSVPRRLAQPTAVTRPVVVLNWQAGRTGAQLPNDRTRRQVAGPPSPGADSDPHPRRRVIEVGSVTDGAGASNSRHS